MAALKAALDAATALVFTVTNVSTFGGNNFRIRMQASGPYTIDTAPEGFSHLSGIFITGATADTTFNYTNLSYTDYFDLVSPEMCSDTLADQVAGKEVGSVLFRIPFDQFTMDIDQTAINDQDEEKKIVLPGSIRGTINFRLYDMFGNLLLCTGSWYFQGSVIRSNF